MTRRRRIKVIAKSQLTILPELTLVIGFGLLLFIPFQWTKSIPAFVVSFILATGLFAYSCYLLFKTRQEEAEAQNRERTNYISSLAGGLVHEIKNPLNSLNLNLQLLKENLGKVQKEKKGGNQELISEIQEELNRLDEILINFLRLARPPKLNLKEENLNRVLEEIVRFVKPECLRNKIKINEILQNPLPPLFLDKRQFKGALLNLILNAKAAMKNGGRLNISTWREGKDICLSISDTGCGISKESQKKIFDLFYSTKEGGSGLGLPIVQQVIHNHNGRIEYQSNEGKGTTFTISLPAANS